VRYLGDLNGGQALRRLVARAYGLEGGAGTHFYDFGTRAAQQRMLEGFRDGLDAIGQSSMQGHAIVCEAVSAFERHAEIFDELGAQI
jgi:heme oxygenase